MARHNKIILSAVFVFMLFFSIQFLFAYEPANVWKYTNQSGTIYTVPVGRTFWLYGMMFQSDRSSSELRVNGEIFWRDGPETKSWGHNFYPPIKFPSGTVFSADLFQASIMIYGYEGTSNPSD